MSDSDEYQKQLDRLSKLEADVNGTGDDDSTIISNESLKIIKAEPETQELENVSQEQPVTIQDAAPIPSDTKTPPQIEEENGSMKSASQQEMENEDKNQVEKGVERDDSNQQEIDEKAIDIQDSMKDEKPSKNNKIDEKSDEMVSKKPASDKDDSSASHNSDSDDSLPEYKKRNGYLSKRVTRNATGSLPKETKTLLMETTEVFDPSKSKKRPTARPGHVNVLAPECTSCGSDVILRPFQRRMLIHPYLKTAVCRQCHEFYHSDTFGVDDEGSQIYCIWCGEGGELIYCDKCEKAFCTDCIKRNFGKKVREKILAQSNWECLVCKPEMTSDLRKVAQMIVKYQNLCIKDQYLIEKFECEVTKADLKKEDYQGIVSTRIKQRNSATLLSSSQQKEESQRGSAESGQSNNEDSEGKEDEEGEDSSENSSGDEYDASKDTENKPIKKKRSKEKVNGKNKESDSEDSSDIDDEEFLKCIRKKAVDRHESNTTTSAKKTDQKVASKETSKPETNGDSSSDDSLFDTGNPSVKAKNIRKCFDSTDGEDEDISDENDELVQKYRNKLSKFKETSDKESEHSNYSEESSATSSDDEEDDKEKSESSDSSKDEQSVSESEVKDSANGDEGKDKTSKNEKKSKTSRKRKKKGGSEKESDEEEEGKKTKRKRKRKKKKSSESDSDEEEEDADKKKKSKKGKRKKIRKILGQNQLQKETVAAQEAEDERRRKLKEKSLPSQQGKILNFILEDLRKEKYRSQPPTIDDEERGKVIEVHKHLKKRLKPHQLDGIQFMYDCCIESVEKVKSGSEGSGAILAHCMGLGKTFQVITFLTTVLNYHYIFGFKRALVVCPLNTILNWKAEFDKWLKDMDDAPEVSVLTDNIHSNDKRLEIVENWFETSGVLIVGYSLFRLLSTGSNIRKKNLKESFKKYLVEPGPDIVICDEGHVIKNEKTGISKALNSLKTKRRVILTGTPLQNNLVEYHCMVSFVKPNLLGTTKEFKNMYENPINNGQCVDATDFDIRLMKERSHILYEQLSGCVQRRDYTVLREFLPQKYEYVLSIKLSDLQVKLYQKYLEKAKATGGMMSKLFECYQTLKKVWTHPWLLEIDALKNEKDSIEDFITDREDTSEDSWEASSEDSDFGPQKKKRKKNSKKKGEKEEKEKEKETEEAKPEDKEPGATNNPDATMVQAIADTIVPVGGSIDYNWFKGEMTEKDEKMLEHSGKLLVTLEILDKASQKGDKVLLFSQSLLALDFLETSITRVGWTKGRDYFRMDGSTKTHHRSSFQKQFNDKSNKRCRLFLISTKAGGLGINLVSANRIILFDMSWNPSDDTQSLFRAYRYGQQKNVYVYRLVARGTMEEKIYDRQVYKESLSSRVVDEKQITRYFSANDLQELFSFDPSAQTCTTSVLANHNPPADDVLASILVDLDPPLVLEYHEHDSLLEHRPDQQLTEEERKAAWENFKADKERRNVVNAPMGRQSVFQRLAAHTAAYTGPIITPIYSNQQELILGGFTNEQIISIQQQLEPVVQSGRLQVKALGGGQLHIQGLAPEQQQVFINSIKEQQAQQIQAAQMARVLPQQHILNQLPPAERALFQQRLALLVQQQQQAQLVAQHQQQAVQQAPAPANVPKPLAITVDSNSQAPITVPDSPGER